jgi:hypothetical protein
LGAVGKSALFGSSGWTLRSVEFFGSPESGDMDSPSVAFTTVPPERVLAPSRNRDRAPDVGVDDVLETTRLVAIDLASVTIGTPAFFEAAAIADSIESRRPHCRFRLFKNDLNRRTAARGFNLAAHNDQSPDSPRGRNAQESRVMVVPRAISHHGYLCELRRRRAQAHLPTLPETPRCRTETATCAPPP